MSAGAFGRAPLGSELDTDLIPEDVRDLAEELRAYAEKAPAARAGLTGRVLAALDGELVERTPGIARLGSVSFLSRLTLGLRPASFRSVLAAAALVAVLGAGVAFAATGGLPFHLPQLWAPEQAAPIQPDSQQPAAPGDEDAQGPADEDVDTSPDPSEDADEDQDEDSDADEDQDEGSGDQDEDADEDEDSGDEDSDNGDADEDEDSGDEDSDNGGGDDSDSDEDDDSTSDEDESDDDADADQAPSDDPDQDDSADAGNSEEG